ncbi:hypothetical protein H0H81_010071 [Sphagnurus paluster]|uniref:Uncharacterized protein n=1 Tax=Sphagnurus paluster TaxID=117069 RepID=A0A9P7FPB2_9AGAR|nr:hypothetical protein H0H81_010071 [Sphagnurus paluster]
MAKGKRKAPSPAESVRPAPSRPTTPVHQASSHSHSPYQGYTDPQHAQDSTGYDSSEELYQQQEEKYITLHDLCAAIDEKKLTPAESYSQYNYLVIKAILEMFSIRHPNHLRQTLATSEVIQPLIAKANRQPPRPPLTPLPTPGPPSTTPLTRGPPTPPAGALAPAKHHAPPATPAPRSSHAPAAKTPAARAPKCAPPPQTTQPATKPTYATALRLKAPRPRKAHLPTKLVAPPSTKWVVIPNDKSQLRDAAKRPSPHHIVGAINRELQAWAGESIGGVQVANLGDSHILAATWMVGCNLLITATKTHDDRGLATQTYSTIVGNALFPIPAFSNAGITVIPYRLAACLQIKGLPTWDPSTNQPVELTTVYKTLDNLGIFEGVKLINNGPAPSDTLSWARNPATFNAESRPCTVTVRFYNHDGRETGSVLKKAFYLLGHRRRFDKWQPKPLPTKKG